MTAAEIEDWLVEHVPGTWTEFTAYRRFSDAHQHIKQTVPQFIKTQRSVFRIQRRRRAALKAANRKGLTR